MSIYSNLSPHKIEIRKDALESIPCLRLSSNKRSVEDPDLIGKIPRCENKIATLVLDLDETLVSYQNNYLYVRPYTRDMLAFFAEKMPSLEVIVWSAGNGKYVDFVLNFLDPENKFISHAISRGKSWMTSHPAVKDLSLLNRKRIIIVDDSIYAAVANGSSAIILPTFHPSHPLAAMDTTLLYILQIISRSVALTQAQLMGPDSAKIAGIPFQQEDFCVTDCDIGEKNTLSISRCIFTHFILEHPFMDAEYINDVTFGLMKIEKLDVADANRVGLRIATFKQELVKM